ncbi:glycosyltransferase [Metapseudomonas boanensis]|uniref:Glycosyltransferase n=1 Tax=Metapseudomonas boanensis TaxID=2822138 RepID=A0ABS5XDK6_9GAMM|nr:glycosyltransferase [Pseudomonas boanensis]MBT8765774.1 glycosyltransferase [Pseudomonas boanensis]
MPTNILFITFGDFRTPTDGGSKFTNEIVSMLRQTSKKVEILNYYDHAPSNSKTIRKILSIFISLFLRLPLPASYFYSRSLINSARKKILDELSKSAPQQRRISIFVDHLELCYITSSLRLEFGDEIEIAHISHNIEPSLLKQRLGEGLAYKYSQLCCDYSKFEKKSLYYVDTIFSISDEEKHHFSKLNPTSSLGSPIKAITIPPTFSYLPLHKSTNETPYKKIVFVASFDWWPNQQAFQWIRDYLSPSLPTGFKIHIYGKNSTKFSAGAPENLVFHGYVDNILEVWDDCFFSVAPITRGAGVNIKVSESLHNRVPVIGSELSFKGISKDYLGGTLKLELDVEAWINALEFYSSNPSEYEKLKRAISYPSREKILDKLRITP